MLTLSQGRLRAQSGQQRRELATGWQLLGSAPGQFDQPAALADELAWVDVPQLGPVADVLRQLKLWSLDGEPRRFDAQDWWYRLRFDAADIDLSGGVYLGLDGLATVAEVWLNGQQVLSSTSMHAAHRLAVGPLLRPMDNELVLAFRSLDQALSKRRPRPRWRAPMIENQQIRWFRTTVLGRTPGWTPPAAVVGPWRGIWLAAEPKLALTALDLRPTVDAGVGRLAVRCSLQMSSANADADVIEQAVLSVTREGVRHVLALASGLSSGAMGGDRLSNLDGQMASQGALWQGELAVPDVALWWPHTHGGPASPPALYQASLSVRLRGQPDAIEFDVGSVGFRDIELDRTGDGFALKLNGVPVFCRGACWTPLDPVTMDGASEQAYRQAIAQVREAGMNMIRLGGTMSYEADAFYDECDRQGVMVWQDFMFANMDYPEDAEFTAGVQAEARQQLARWQARPAVTVLCGNSEVEQQAAMFGATRERWAPALFHEVLANEAQAACPDVPYWPSSAHGGAFPHQGDAGTTSYYGVGAYQRELDDARRSNVRFATECLAFSNIPEPAGLSKMPGGLGLRMHHATWKARAPRDLGAGWDFEDVRDHYVARLFDIDPTRLRYADHDRYLALGRVAVGEVMAATFVEWRRAASPCHGALIWFLRDLWPGAGWGVVDSQGHPKAPYYYLKRALQPVSIGLTDEGGNGLYVHLNNEAARPLQAEVEVTAWRHGQVQVAQGKQSIELPAHGALSQPLLAWFDWFADWSWAYRFGPASAQVLVATLKSPEGEVLAQAFAFPTGLALPMERDLGLKATAHCVAPGVFEVLVSAERFAQAVHFDVDACVPDDAYFHLAPGAQRRVVLRTTSTTSATLSGCVRALNSDAAVNIQMAPAAS